MRQILEKIDNALVQYGPVVLRAKPKLIILALHSVWESKITGVAEMMHPQQRLTLGGLRQALEVFSVSGYKFVSAVEVEAGLPTNGQFCLVTFDDGYRNNLDALPVLREFGAPAIIFIVPDNIETGDSFWWDAVYRKGRAGGKSVGHIEQFIEKVKQCPANARAGLLRQAGFSESDFKPVGDTDRPLNREELRLLAKEPGITVGNHTWSHEILPRCTREEQQSSLLRTQHYVQEVCGYTPRWIAYPNGDYNQEILRVAKTTGLLCGVSLDEDWSSLPLELEKKLHLKRFLLWGDREIRTQCLRMQMGASFTTLGRRLRRHVF